MQENGYMMDAETREVLARRMRAHEEPRAPDKEARRAFHDQLRAQRRRKSQFKLPALQRK